MRRKKVVQILSMVWFGFCLFVLAVCTQEPDFTADPGLYGTVDASGVFHIYESADMHAFLRYVKNGHTELDGVLEADVDMGDTAYVVKRYAGCLNGQGHTVAGLSWSLFVNLQADGRIENLTVISDMEAIETIGAGGLVYYNYGTIHNCHVEGSVSGYRYTGGIAAVNLGTIVHCTNRATVTSLEDGSAYDEDGWMGGYGAGGIAGLCATNRGDSPAAECAIVDCDNYGAVTAKTYAGGIVAYLDDQTRKDETDAAAARGTQDAPHDSLSGCVNYGTVTVENRLDLYTRWYTRPAGICAYLRWGDIFHCGNRGMVRFAEDAPQYNENGRCYANTPVAIAYIMGEAPTAKNHVTDCVNLKGTIAGTMRNENIMEVTEEEWAAWERAGGGEQTADYVSNNWEFDLGEAVRLFAFEPLEIMEPEASVGRPNYYLCDAFALYLPAYMVIEEVSLAGRESEHVYALHIQIEPEAWRRAIAAGDYQAEEFGGAEECWILRKEADVASAWKQTQETNTPEHVLDLYFLDEIYDSLSISALTVCSVGPPLHIAYRPAYYGGRRIMAERNLSEFSYLAEGDHTLGNVLSVPLWGNPKDGFYADWVMLFTTRETNLCPSPSFIQQVENGFYPLEGDEALTIAAPGDTLSGLAKLCTGDAADWPLLAGMNGIDHPDKLMAGQSLLLPAADTYEKKVDRLTVEVLRMGTEKQR